MHDYTTRVLPNCRDRFPYDLAWLVQLKSPGSVVLCVVEKALGSW